MKFKKIVVIGCGTMGSQISALLSIFGYNVTCITTKELDVANNKINELIENPFWKRVMLRNNPPAVSFSNKLSACNNADLIIEAIVEDFQTKNQLFESIKPFISNSCLISTITSTYSINKLAEAIKPDNFIGIHFFNPVISMKIIELIPTKTTTQQAMNNVSNLCENLGKKILIAPDEPGFIVNKLLTPFWIDCIKYLEDTNGCPKEINDAIKLGANLPIGPFEIVDLIGIDMFCRGAESLYKQTQDPRYKTPEILVELLKKEKFGKKTGEGILRY